MPPRNVTAVAARAGAALLLTLAAGAGCAHAPRGHFDAAARQVCAGHVCYRFGELGPAWRLVHQESAAIGFFDDALGTVVEANATCRDDADAAPLVALTRELLVGYTDRRLRDQTLVALDQREALRTRLDARLDGVPMSLEIYVLKRNGCIFDLAYAAPPDRFAQGARDFSRFVAGFADTRPPPARAGL
jgi:hypothetical protein